MIYLGTAGQIDIPPRQILATGIALRQGTSSVGWAIWAGHKRRASPRQSKLETGVL